MPPDHPAPASPGLSKTSAAILSSLQVLKWRRASGTPGRCSSASDLAARGAGPVRRRQTRPGLARRAQGRFACFRWLQARRPAQGKGLRDPVASVIHERLGGGRGWAAEIEVDV
ncbi:uncharacterized protein UV8b_07019 [Ustilaginoidea virens]|nr:uncharacterized protein UV8b_07019 [Ustilaginoidea virens]QUC22778.1 hypothetical protein UV8b_07019 [Ustilaginoidea virens]